MWAGRFAKEENARVNDFNSSIAFDSRMAREDITGSMAHARMLGKCGIIDASEADRIIEGLRGILADLESGALAIDPGAEDIHMFVEQTLTERIGDAGKRLHTARSRNDQVALDIRLHLRAQAAEIQTGILSLIETICQKAENNTGTIMPGYTHLQRAQPVTYAHYILAYAFMLQRDCTRLDDCVSRMNRLPLGACALAGTTYPIDRRMVAAELGFDGVVPNSLDAVSDRDFAVELLADLSMLMMHLSRFSEEIILWCSSEFGFIELDDAFSTGSSIMPQKKNPDVAELVRGKTGRVYGDLTTLLTVMKGLPLAYNKDMQEDKEALFDAIDTVKLCLEVFGGMFESLTVRGDRMRAAAAVGYINATDCADYLVRKGLPFRTAYKVVGGIVGRYAPQGKPLEALSLEELNAACADAGIEPVFDADVYDAVALETCLANRTSEGGPAPQSAAAQIRLLRSFLQTRRDANADEALKIQ